MHYEIFTNEAGFDTFYKRGKQNYVVDGQCRGKTELWGDSHFVIPEGTPYLFGRVFPRLRAAQSIKLPSSRYAS